MKRRIVWVVDHNHRDLPAIVWAKLQLERRGHEVLLIRNGFDALLPAYRADAVVFNHMALRPRQDVARRLRAAGTAVVVCPTEGAPFFPETQALEAGLHYDLSHVDLFLFWGPKIRDLALRHKTIAPERARVVGCPRFDFYADPLRRTLPPKRDVLARHGLPADRKVVLLTTSFTSAPFHERDQSFWEQDFKRLGLDKTVPLSAREYARGEWDVRDLFARSAARLADETPDAAFVLRPHPNEDAEYWRRWIEALPPSSRARVALAPTGPIGEYLHAADVVVGRACTTSVEAWLLGVPTVEFRLHEGDWIRSPEVESGSHVARSHEELRDAVAKLERGAHVPPPIAAAREDLIAEYYHRVDGRATLRVVDALDATLQGRPRPRLALDRALLQGLAKRVVHEGTGWRLHDRRLGLRADGRDKHGRVRKAFRPKDARGWDARLRPLLPEAPA